MKRQALRVARLAGGGLLILGGVVAGFLPVLQGWLLIIAGLALMAPESRRARALLDWAKSKVRRDAAPTVPEQGEEESGEEGDARR